MAASSIDAFVVIYGDPETSLMPKTRANISVTYESFIHHDDIRVLSKNTNGDQDIEGMIYVPEYPEGSPCIDQTSQYIPQNATRIGDLPRVEKFFVALAPWTSPQCVLSLLDAVKNSIEAFIFYLPESEAGAPPAVSDPVWGLGDGGSWKSKNKFPVYAIPGPTGASIMTQLGQYSGSISDAPNGTELVEQYSTRNGTKMYAVVELADATSLPSLWAFLLIVLGIVLFLIGMTSSVMHLYQRRRRHALRRRIINGEVDLERLGIKRLTVPQDAINMLPTFVYNPSEKELLALPRDHITALSDFPIENSDDTTTASHQVAPVPDAASTPDQQPALSPVTRPALASLQSYQQPSYAQPTCPICLDDFTPQETTVRSLPCHHIYHPECIDPFLLQNSSLCPVCKSKVLPKGYCPELITNGMVRRERQQRRNRDRVRRIRGEEAASQIPVASIVEPRQSRLVAVRGRMASFHRQFGRVSRSASTAGVSQPPAVGSATAVEMRNMNDDAGLSTSPPPITSMSRPPTGLSAPPAPLSPPPANIAPEQAQPRPNSSPNVAPNNRSERARRRANIFLREQQPTVEEQERERWARLPRCTSLFFVLYRVKQS
ncbi:MAG: hypothetical protein Q9213_004476 [Squamulea squamosa]